MFVISKCRVAPKIIGKPLPLLTSSLAPPPCKKFEDLKETVIPALIILGPSLHYDPVLMYKVRILIILLIPNIMSFVQSRAVIDKFYL